MTLSERQSATRDRAIDAALWALSALTLLALLWFSLVSDPPGEDAVPFADKGWHAISYAIVTGCWLLAGVWRPGRGNGRFADQALAIIIGFAALGAFIEVIQHWVDRHAETSDWVADVIGTAAALAAWWILRRIARADGSP